MAKAGLGTLNAPLRFSIRRACQSIASDACHVSQLNLYKPYDHFFVSVADFAVARILLLPCSGERTKRDRQLRHSYTST